MRHSSQLSVAILRKYWIAYPSFGTIGNVNTSLKASIAAGGGRSRTLVRKTILMVEDRSDDIELLRIMFKRSRILNPLQAVHTVKDTIRYLEGDGSYADRQTFPFPTLLLIDLHLPDGSGFDVLRWIQSHQHQAPLGVVVLTGSDIGDIKQSYDLGAHSFLVKPLKFFDLENMVHHVRGMNLARSSKGHLLDVAP
jgi:CheY-like chemotaxis protein